MSYILLTWLLAPIWWPLSLIRALRQAVPQRILIAEIAGIGDVVCSTAVFQAIRARYPQAHIGLMVDTVLSELAAQDNNLDEVIPFAYNAQHGFNGRWRLMRIMGCFDTFICLIPSAAQITTACWAAMPRRYSVLPDISVRSYELLKPLMTHTQAHKTNTSFVSTQLELVKPLDISGSPVDRRLHVTEQSLRKAKSLLGQQCRWIGLAIGSGQGIKAIRYSVLYELVIGLLKSSGYGVVLIGGAKEKHVADRLMSEIGLSSRCINAVGHWPLGELAGLLKNLTLFIGVDSGVTYMADALGVPLVYLPGPASPDDQGPMLASKVTLKKTLDCAPCSRVFVTPSCCRVAHHACIDGFDASDILNAANSLLGGAGHD